MKVILKKAEKILENSFTVESLITVEISLNDFEVSFVTRGNLGVEPSLIHKGNDKKPKSSTPKTTVLMEMLCFNSNLCQIRRSPARCNKKCRSKKEHKPYGIQQDSLYYDEENRKLKMEIICFCIPKHIQKGSKFAKFRFILRSAEDEEISFESEFLRIESNRGKKRHPKKTRDPNDNKEISDDVPLSPPLHFNGLSVPSPTNINSSYDSQYLDDNSEHYSSDATNSSNSNQSFDENLELPCESFGDNFEPVANVPPETFLNYDQCYSFDATNSSNSNQAFDENFDLDDSSFSYMLYFSSNKFVEDFSLI